MDWIPLLARFGMSDKGGYYVGSRRFRLAGAFGKTIASGSASADTHWFRSISLRKNRSAKWRGIPLLACFGSSDKGDMDFGTAGFDWQAPSEMSLPSGRLRLIPSGSISSLLSGSPSQHKTRGIRFDSRQDE